MALSEKMIEVLVFSGIMTIWVVVGASWWEELIVNSGHTYGLGEIFLGFTIPAVASTVVAWFLVKRIRANRP